MNEYYLFCDVDPGDCEGVEVDCPDCGGDAIANDGGTYCPDCND